MGAFPISNPGSGASSELSPVASVVLGHGMIESRSAASVVVAVNVKQCTQ